MTHYNGDKTLSIVMHNQINQCLLLLIDKVHLSWNSIQGLLPSLIYLSLSRISGPPAPGGLSSNKAVSCITT